ncbi:hypothetical protein D3C75_1124930 [compost metagenome]
MNILVILVDQQMIHLHPVSLRIEDFAQQAVIRLQIDVQLMLAVHTDDPPLRKNNIVTNRVHRPVRPVIISPVVAHKGRESADIETPPGTHIGEQNRVSAAWHNICR